MYPNLVIFKDTASRLFTKYQHFHVNLLAKIKLTNRHEAAHSIGRLTAIREH